jgi:UDP-N-acetylglucosamine transferase subunit ALG13
VVINGSDRPTVLVTVGGDHHPFDRLMTWVGSWLADGAAGAVHCVVQYGTASPPADADATPYLDHNELMSVMDSASVIITSGGPSTLMEARQRGHVPIVVPRRSDLGEHVDDHQLAFCQHLRQHGFAVPVLTEPEFRSAVDAALTNEATDRPTAARREPEAVSRIGAIIDEVAETRRRP